MNQPFIHSAAVPKEQALKQWADYVNGPAAWVSGNAVTVEPIGRDMANVLIAVFGPHSLLSIDSYRVTQGGPMQPSQ